MAGSKTKSITKPPDTSVKSLASPKVSRSGTVNLNIDGSWTFPTPAFDTSKDNRFEGVVVEFGIDTNFAKKSNNKISNSGKKSATISGVTYKYKKALVLKGKVSKARWGNVNRKLFYPHGGKTKKTTYVRIYQLTKEPTWNGSWCLPKNGSRFLGYVPVSKCGNGKDYQQWGPYWSKRGQNAQIRPRIGTKYFMSSKNKNEIIEENSYTTSPLTADGVAITVQGYNSKCPAITTSKPGEIKKPVGNPSAKGYYEITGKTYSPSKDKTVKAKKKYFKTPTPKAVFSKSVPKSVSYFEFSPPANPSVSLKLEGEGTNLRLQATISSTDDKSCHKERWDTHYEVWYSYGEQLEQEITAQANRGRYKYGSVKPIKWYEKCGESTSNKIALTIDPAALIKDQHLFGNRTSITGLLEGEWLKIEVYAFNRGIAGPSCLPEGSQSMSPPKDKMKSASYTYAWSAEPIITSLRREGQHYRINFGIQALVDGEVRRTGTYTLQRLNNFRPDAEDVAKWTAAQWQAAAAASDNWKDVRTVGGGMRSICDNVREAAFEPTRRTYYRIKSESVTPGLPALYSEPKVISGYTNVATAVNQRSMIVEASPYDNGNVLRVLVALTRTKTSFQTSIDPPAKAFESGLFEKKNGKYYLTSATYTKNATTYYESLEYEPITQKKAEESNPAAEGWFVWDAESQTFKETSMVSGKHSDVIFFKELGPYAILNSNGTEITWSDKNYSWKSTDKPEGVDILDVNAELQDLASTYADLMASESGRERIRRNPAWLRAIGERYTKVEETQEGYLEENPKESEWYELSGAKYILSTDTQVDENKVYYVQTYGPTKPLYQHLQECYIGGLKQGVSYYIRCRRFNDDTETGGVKTYANKYGRYCPSPDMADSSEGPVLLCSRVTNLKLSAPSVLLDGSDIELGWIYDEPNWSSTEVYESEPQESFTVYYTTGAVMNGTATEKVGKQKRPVDPYTIYPLEWNKDDPNDKSSKKDSAKNVTIPYDVVKNHLTEQTVGNSNRKIHVAYLLVRVRVGGVDSAVSNLVAVTFVPRPKANISFSQTTLRSLPLKATLRTNDPGASAIVRVVSDTSCSSWGPEGQAWQPSGTVLYSRKLRPTWTAATSNVSTNYSDTPYYYDWFAGNDEITGLMDGGEYRLEYIAVSEYEDINYNASFETYSEEYARSLPSQFSTNGDYLGNLARNWSLEQAMSFDYDTDRYQFDSASYDAYGERIGVTSKFKVDFDHKALALPKYTGNDGTSFDRFINPPKVTSEGVEFTIPIRTMDSELTLDQRESRVYHSQDDVIDLYRVTPDGTYSIKTDIPFSIKTKNTTDMVTVTDTMPMYSNYANCRYRLAVRTPEGDVDWCEVPSPMRGHCVRFDWGDTSAEQNGGYSYLELPYNVKWNDQWGKQARIQEHMDGSYSAYWRGGVDRQNSLSTELLKFEDPEQVERVRALANYSGPVYVRLPDGCAFCANVEVNNFENTYDKMTLSASFSAQEIGMIDRYASDAVTIKHDLS